MGLFDFFKKAGEPQALPSKSFLQSVSNNNFFLGLDNSFEGLGVEGYLSNPYVYACIDQRASNLAAIPFKLMDGDREITDSFLLKMFDNVFYGNQPISQFDLFYRLSTFLDISGNAYIWGDSATRPRELVLYDPSDVEVITANGYIEYMIGDQKINLKDNLLIHLANFNPNDKIVGASPSQPSALSIDTNNAGRVYNAVLMKKHTKVSGIIKGTAGAIPEELRESFKQEFMARYGGPTNAGSVMFMGGDLEYHESQMKPTDMDWSKAMEVSGKEIGMTFKVPNELLGIGKMTYENVKEAKAYFVKQCIVPQMEKILDVFNRQLVKLFGENLKLVVDFDNIESIKEYRIESRQKELQSNSLAAINLYNSGIISIQEARELVGFEIGDFEGSDPYQEETPEPESVEPEPIAPEDAPDNKSVCGHNHDSDSKIIEEDGSSWIAEIPPNADVKTKRMIRLGSQRRRANNWFRTYTKKFKSPIQKELKRQRRETLSAWEKSNGDAGTFMELIGSFRNTTWKDRMDDVYKYRETVIINVGKSQQRAFEKEFDCRSTKAIDANNPEIQQFLKSYTATRISEINKSTEKEIRNIISRALNEGKGIGDIADDLDELFDNHIIPKRAEMIARTEIHPAVMYGSQLAAKSLSSVGQKKWMSTNDDRTRETHLLAGAESAVDMDQTFMVGSDALSFPGDPVGSAEEVINCRCALGYIEKETIK